MIPRLRRFARALAQRADAADDLVQETLERALTREHLWQRGTRLDSWLYRMAQNLWIDQCRKAKRRGIHVDVDELRDKTGTDGQAAMDTHMRLREAGRAMAALPEDQRAAVALVLIEGLSYQEAAEVLQVPPGTIASRLARAKTALAEMLADRPANLRENTGARK